MKRSDRYGGSLRPWPLALLAVVAISSGTGLLSGSDSRNAAGEALIIMGGLVVGAWVAMVAAELGGKTVSGFSERDRKGEGEVDDEGGLETRRGRRGQVGEGPDDGDA